MIPSQDDRKGSPQNEERAGEGSVSFIGDQAFSPCLDKGSFDPQPVEDSDDNSISFFFIKNPSGYIDSVAGLENLPEFEVFEEPPIAHSRLQCYHCNRLLEYDNRAQLVQCGNCNSLNAARQGHSIGARIMIVICGRCHTRNIAAVGSTYVECWLCHTVCQVDYPGGHSHHRSRSSCRRSYEVCQLMPRDSEIRHSITSEHDVVERFHRSISRAIEIFSMHGTSRRSHSNRSPPSRSTDARRTWLSHLFRSSGIQGESQAESRISSEVPSHSNIDSVEGNSSSSITLNPAELSQGHSSLNTISEGNEAISISSNLHISDNLYTLTSSQSNNDLDNADIIQNNLNIFHPENQCNHALENDLDRDLSEREASTSKRILYRFFSAFRLRRTKRERRRHSRS